MKQPSAPGPKLRVRPSDETLGHAGWQGQPNPELRLDRKPPRRARHTGYHRGGVEFDEELMRIAFARLKKDEKRTFVHWSNRSKLKRPKPSLEALAEKAHSWHVALLRRWVDFDSPECRLFPGVTPGFPARCRYNFKAMATARAMLLLTQGLPKDKNALATHICGNGHLSCVNPTHLRWGTAADNARDAIVHNGAREFIAGMDRGVVAEIKKANKLASVLAWEYGIPRGVVTAIRSGEMWPSVKAS